MKSLQLAPVASDRHFIITAQAGMVFFVRQTL